MKWTDRPSPTASPAPAQPDRPPADRPTAAPLPLDYQRPAPPPRDPGWGPAFRAAALFLAGASAAGAAFSAVYAFGLGRRWTRQGVLTDFGIGLAVCFALAGYGAVVVLTMQAIRRWRMGERFTDRHWLVPIALGAGFLLPLTLMSIPPIAKVGAFLFWTYPLAASFFAVRVRGAEPSG